MRYYSYFEKNLLPSSGGIDNQSALLFEAFDIIDNEKYKIKEQDVSSNKRYVDKNAGRYN